jgi:microcystin-dependent protein
MPEYTSSNITAIVPGSDQSANMILGFEQYHTSIADDINSKQATITGAASSVVSSNLTANYVVVANSTGKISSGTTITTSELGVLDGLASQSEILFPTGILASYAGFSVPDGWLFCNGETITKSSYPNLANITSPTFAPDTVYVQSVDADTTDVIFVFNNIQFPSPPINYEAYLTANAAVRTAIGLDAVSDFPASNVIFVATGYSVAMTYSAGGKTTPDTTWSNNGQYNSSQLGITINLYGNTGSILSTKLPDFRNRFVYGSSSILHAPETGGFAEVGTTHSLSSAYSRIDFSGGNVFVQEASVAAWSATERFSLSGSIANTSSRTIGVNVIGTTSGSSNIPPYLYAKYIIKT